MSYYPNMFNGYHHGYSPVAMYGEPYGGGGGPHYLPSTSSRHAYPPPPAPLAMHSPYHTYSSSSPMVSMAYHNYYREPNVLNRLLNRARYGTGPILETPTCIQE
ncbi:unnamed protein product [Absidia cylindrospora]